MQTGKSTTSTNPDFHQANKYTFSIVHITEDKLQEFFYQASTLKHTSILTVAFLLHKISYLYTSIWFSLQVLVAIEESINFTMPAFFLTPFCFVLWGKNILLPLTQHAEFSFPYLKGNIAKRDTIYVLGPCVSYFLTTID